MVLTAGVPRDAASFARWFEDNVEYAFVAFTQDWRPVACSYLTHVRPGVKGSFHGFATEEYRHPKYSVPVSTYAINHFFDFFDFRRLESVIAVDNIPAVIHATRLGFEWDGVLKEHYQRNDAWVDCHIGTKMRGGNTMRKIVLMFFALLVAYQANAASVEDAMRLVDHNKSAQAISILEELSGKGSLEAKYELGKLLYYSATDSKSAKVAYDLLISAAKKGSSDAQLELGDIYLYGYNLKVDVNKALMFYMQAVKSGDVRAQFRVGRLLIINGEQSLCEDSVFLLRQSSRRGYSKASDMLGRIYLSGECVEQSDEQSIRYYMKSKDYIGSSSFMLGVLCLNGQISCSDEDYYKYNKNGYDLGCNESITFLADCYFYGKGVVRNYQKALELYKEGADIGVSSCMMRLFKIYNEGAFVAKNDELAQHYLRKAYQFGDKKAVEIVKKN